MLELIWMIDLAALVFVAISLKQLDGQREAFIATDIARRLRLAILAVIAGSVLAVGVLALVIVLALRADMLVRFAHSLLVLGLWIIITSSAMVLMFRFRLTREVSWIAMAGLVPAVLMVLLLAPAPLIVMAAQTVDWLVGVVTSLVIGAVTIGVCLVMLLWLLFRLRRG